MDPNDRIPQGKTESKTDDPGATGLDAMIAGRSGSDVSEEVEETEEAPS